MGGDLVRNSLRLALAAFLTAAIALWFERILFLWYPLIAVVVTVDDSEDQTIKAAIGRMLGTCLGGLVTFAVHSVLDGWIGVLVSLLLMLPMLRLFGWQSAIGTATLISLVFLMVPRYSALNWDYVFNRGLDTAVGCLIAIFVGLLFWPHNTMERLEREDETLRTRLSNQLGRYRIWLHGAADRPVPLHAAPFSASLKLLEDLVEQELRGPRRARLLRRRWPERLALWRGVRHHWLALERLLAALPAQLPTAGQAPGSPLWPLITNLEPALASPNGGQAANPKRVSGAARQDMAVVAPALMREDLLALAQSADLPPLLLLAIASEQAAVAKALAELGGLRAC
ncbi:MAG: FUSC family protein [Synechococcaceae cyanobacterium]|nr:FUSC family protein [Synechococcaceae cyanobacterium]